MNFTNHKYSEGQEVQLGKRVAIVEEQRRFWGKPSYLLYWNDVAGNTVRGIFTEKEIETFGNR